MVGNRQLDWEASYEIVLALADQYPQFGLEELTQLGLATLRQMILSLPTFADDGALAHDDLLQGILRDWYEELLETTSVESVDVVASPAEEKHVFWR
jgi:FeS assembly protein IscX